MSHQIIEPFDCIRLSTRPRWVEKVAFLTWGNVKMLTAGFFSFQKIQRRYRSLPLILLINKFVMMNVSSELKGREYPVRELPFSLGPSFWLGHCCHPSLWLYEPLTKKLLPCLHLHLMLPSRPAFPNFPFPILPLSTSPILPHKEGLPSLYPFALGKFRITHQDPVLAPSALWSFTDSIIWNSYYHFRKCVIIIFSEGRFPFLPRMWAANAILRAMGVSCNWPFSMFLNCNY